MLLLVIIAGAHRINPALNEIPMNRSAFPQDEQGEVELTPVVPQQSPDH